MKKIVGILDMPEDYVDMLMEVGGYDSLLELNGKSIEYECPLQIKAKENVYVYIPSIDMTISSSFIDDKK